MLNVMIKICGILKIRSTLSISVCFVAKLKRITKETETVMRAKNIVTLEKPLPPEIKALNNAGREINKEKTGINISVRFKKYPNDIFESIASSKQNKYNVKIIEMFFVKSIDKRNSRKLKVLIRGSSSCKNPFFKADSCAKIDSLKNASVFKMVRSIKLWVLNFKVFPFLQVFYYYRSNQCFYPTKE